MIMAVIRGFVNEHLFYSMTFDHNYESTTWTVNG